MTADLDPALISFRRLALRDLPLLHRWLNTDHVAQWYGAGHVRYPAYERVVERYAPRIRGEEPVDSYVIVYAGAPIGYIQTYRVADYPEDRWQVESGAAAIDLLIGEVEFLHRGLGTHIIRRFLAEIVFGQSDATCCIIGPEPENAAAIRAYEKAGFRYLKTVQIPDGEPPEEYLMRIAREDVIDNSGDSPHRR